VNALQGPQTSTIDDVLPLAVVILIALGVGGAVLYRRRPTGV
jgi:LPXTG-motif cell wall-anchored protein